MLSKEFVLGLIQAQGSFTFCSVPAETAAGIVKLKVPAFILSMTHADRELLIEVASSLGLKNKVYAYPSKRTPGSAILIVRDLGQLKNVLVPLLRGRLMGEKKAQFEEWILNMSSDPDVPERFRIIPQLTKKGGFYDKQNMGL